MSERPTGPMIFAAANAVSEDEEGQLIITEQDGVELLRQLDSFAGPSAVPAVWDVMLFAIHLQKKPNGGVAARRLIEIAMRWLDKLGVSRVNPKEVEKIHRAAQQLLGPETRRDPLPEGERMNLLGVRLSKPED